MIRRPFVTLTMHCIESTRQRLYSKHFIQSIKLQTRAILTSQNSTSWPITCYVFRILALQIISIWSTVKPDINTMWKISIGGQTSSKAMRTRFVYTIQCRLIWLLWKICYSIGRSDIQLRQIMSSEPRWLCLPEYRTLQT